MSWEDILKTEWKRTRPYDRHIDGPFDMEKPAGKRFEFRIYPDKSAKARTGGLVRFYTFSTPVDVIDETAAKEIALDEAEEYFGTDNLHASLEGVVEYRFSNKDLKYFLFKDGDDNSDARYLQEFYVPKRPKGVSLGKSFAVIDWYHKG